MPEPSFITAAELTRDLAHLGVVPGDVVMVHAACKRVGPVLGGPDAIIAALRDAVGPAGTLMAYLDWEAAWESLVDAEGRTLPEWRPHVLPLIRRGPVPRARTAPCRNSCARHRVPVAAAIRALRWRHSEPRPNG